MWISHLIFDLLNYLSTAWNVESDLSQRSIEQYRWNIKEIKLLRTLWLLFRTDHPGVRLAFDLSQCSIEQYRCNVLSNLIALSRTQRLNLNKTCNIWRCKTLTEWSKYLGIYKPSFSHSEAVYKSRRMRFRELGFNDKVSGGKHGH